MKRILLASVSLLAALSAAPVFAGGPCGCCAPAPCVTTCEPCAEECPHDRWAFRIELCEEKCKVEVPTHKWYAITSKTVCEKEDPCTGCKSKTVVVDVLPVEKHCPKWEEKTKYCGTIYMECRPVLDIHCVQAPAK